MKFGFIIVVTLNKYERLQSYLNLKTIKAYQAISAVEAGQKICMVHAFHRSLGKVGSGKSLVYVRDDVRPVLEERIVKNKLIFS